MNISYEIIDEKQIFERTDLSNLDERTIINEMFYCRISMTNDEKKTVSFRAHIFELISSFIGGLRTLEMNKIPKEYEDASVGVFDSRYTEYYFNIYKLRIGYLIYEDYTDFILKGEYEYLLSVFEKLRKDVKSYAISLAPKLLSNPFFH
ncbi:hypothetical protein [Winogradskyella sp.]|uniref:hypothetical protein n=1 Tax=Winogradskyella sp. TaxID=1883156 RepID=UPI003BA98896